MLAQRAYTLVEMAVVLVIAGLLLGGALKTQELVAGARVKALAADFRTIPAYVHAFQDRYRALPGDMPQAWLDTRFGAGAATAATGGTRENRRIEGAWDAGAGAESYLAWQHLRLANLAPGPTDPAAPGFAPTNVLGGRVGFTSVPAIAGTSGTYTVCSAGIPGAKARHLDAQMDDGRTDSGAMRATLDGQNAVATAAIVPDAAYTVCMVF